jgi:hypothetical protein
MENIEKADKSYVNLIITFDEYEPLQLWNNDI